MLEKAGGPNNQLHQLEVNAVRQSVNWATELRKTQSIEQQAQIFYESFRIILVKEDELK